MSIVAIIDSLFEAHTEWLKRSNDKSYPELSKGVMDSLDSLYELLDSIVRDRREDMMACSHREEGESTSESRVTPNNGKVSKKKVSSASKIGSEGVGWRSSSKRMIFPTNSFLLPHQKKGSKKKKNVSASPQKGPMFRDFKFPPKSQAKYVRSLCTVLTSLMSHR